MAGPEPPAHDATITLKPVPSHSPSTPAKDDGPGTRAKKRGWSACCMCSSAVSTSVLIAASGSPGSSGGGPPSAAISSPGDPVRSAGVSRSSAKCSTTRSTTQ